MSTITIRNLNTDTKKKLRVLAAQNGHSMEEEVRRILTRAVNQEEKTGFGTFINNQFKDIDGKELEIPARSQTRPATTLAD